MPEAVVQFVLLSLSVVMMFSTLGIHCLAQVRFSTSTPRKGVRTKTDNKKQQETTTNNNKQHTHINKQPSKHTNTQTHKHTHTNTNTKHKHQFSLKVRISCVTIFPCVSPGMDGSSGRPPVEGGAAWRRRERRLCSWCRHEQQTVRVALAAATHHSVQHNGALRGLKTATRAREEESDEDNYAKGQTTPPPRAAAAEYYLLTPDAASLQQGRGRLCSESRGRRLGWCGTMASASRSPSMLTCHSC